MLDRLAKVAEDILPEAQFAFRSGRGTTGMRFFLRQFQEKCREYCLPLYIAFIGFTKALESIDRSALWKILAKYGCPPKLLNLIRQFHDGMSARVITNGKTSQAFAVDTGVKQGCVLAPTLLALYLAAMLERARELLPVGRVSIKCHLDGSLYNIQRFGAKTKTSLETICELLLLTTARLLQMTK